MDRIRGKLNWWKEKNLSYVGKNILIKVIPTYVMRIFKFLENLCGYMDMIAQNFLWGANKEKRKACETS